MDLNKYSFCFIHIQLAFVYFQKKKTSRKTINLYYFIKNMAIIDCILFEFARFFMIIVSSRIFILVGNKQLYQSIRVLGVCRSLSLPPTKHYYSAINIFSPTIYSILYLQNQLMQQCNAMQCNGMQWNGMLLGK